MNATARIGLDRERSAQLGGALAHGKHPHTTVHSLRQADAVILNVNLQRAVEGQPNVTFGSLRVFRDIGQCFTDDSIGGHFDSSRQFWKFTVSFKPPWFSAMLLGYKVFKVQRPLQLVMLKIQPSSPQKASHAGFPVWFVFFV